MGIKNDISIYNSNFKKVHYNLPSTEKKNENEGKSYAYIINCSQQGVDLISFNQNETKIEGIRKIREESSTIFFEMKDSISLLGNRNNLKVIFSKDKVLNKEYPIAGGIQIGNDEAIFTSNSVLFNGKDKLFNYDSKRKDVTEFKLGKEYSFTLSNQSLKLMSDERGNKKFLLCGCTKYKPNQKNGILIVDLKSNNSKFYETDDFEVYCFCPINVEEIRKNLNVFRTAFTNYFFAGGFEVNKRTGAIKLFKLKMDDKKILCEIEFVVDIVLENKIIPKLVIIKEKIFDSDSKKEKNIEYEKLEDYYFTGFKRNISSIIQTKKTRKILITCWDGNVYLFSEPNIILYLEEDNKNNKLKNKN